MKIAKKKVSYIVYRILVDGVSVYIGRTNNITRRQNEHNTAINNPKGKDYNKELYKWLRSSNIDSVELTIDREFKTLVESKRWEFYLILEDHFKDNKLKQTVPPISDYYR